MQSIDICKDWKFCKKGSAEMKQVTLPHDAMLFEKRDPECGSGSGCAYFPGGIYEYTRMLEIPIEWENKVVMIRFEGVYRCAEITVNDRKVGEIRNGYTERIFNLSDVLDYGAENQIRVTVDNSNVPNSRWYSGSGIYRPVRLFVFDQDHIEPDGIRIHTTSYIPAKIAVSVKHTGGEIKVHIKKDGKTIAKSEGSDSVMEIPDAHLWSCDDPYLYSCEVELLKNGRVMDQRNVLFGIRKIEWSRKGFFVNGVETLLKGGCIHHDNGILGACACTEAEERKVQIMKTYGFNAIRSSHNPCSRALLDACDKYGMYVIDESWDMWYQHKNEYDYASDFIECYRDDLKSMTEKDYNHPSVVMYSIGNEVTEPAEKEGIELAEKLVGLIHCLDSTRPVTAGINLMILSSAVKGTIQGEMADQAANMSHMDSTMFNQLAAMAGSQMNHYADDEESDRIVSPILDLLDIAGYNYASGRYELDGKIHPDRLILGSETFPQDIPQNWKAVEKCPWLIGDFMWTAWDYLGEAGLGAWSYSPDAMNFAKPYPWLLSGSGVIDITGHGEGGALLAKAVWKSNGGKAGIAVTPANHPGEEVIKSVWRGTNAIPSWSWKGCGGNPVTVEVYTEAAKVILFLNDEMIGEAVPTNSQAVFETVYQPGILTVKGYDEKGNIMEEGTLESAEGSVHIRIRKEKEVPCKKDDILFIEIDICGENDVIEANADEPITVRTKGAELLGFGSAWHRSEETFVSGTYTTCYGRALAAVRITKPDCASIEAEGITLKKQVISL